MPYQVIAASVKSTLTPSQSRTFDATAPMSAPEANVAIASRTQPVSGRASLLRNATISPEECSTPRLQPPVNPRFAPESTKVKSRSEAFSRPTCSGPEPLSTTMTSSLSCGQSCLRSSAMLVRVSSVPL